MPPAQSDDLIVDASQYNNAINSGLRLAETPMEEGGWAEYFMETDDGDYRIDDPIIKAGTANLMENAKRWLVGAGGARRGSDGKYRITEATRSALIGGFSDYLFPIIRAAFPNNPINELVSVQPTNRRVATVVYWNWIYASNKGSIAAGTRAFDANVGKQDAYTHYSDNVIDAENTGLVVGTPSVVTGTLTYNDGGGVLPGTVTLTTTCSSGAATFSDNGNGSFVGTFTGGGTVTAGAGTFMNYATGAFSVTIATETFTAVQVVAAYRYNSEGSALTPQMDVQIVTSTTDTQRRALRLNYSLEAMFDVNAEFGVDLEPNLLSGAAEQLNFEIARQLVGIMWGVAQVNGTFPTTPPSTNYSKQQHFMDLLFALNQASNQILTNTQKGNGNWIIADVNACNIIETMSSTLFEPAPKPANVMGIHFIGTLAGKWRVYKDVHLQTLPGASIYGNMLMGFKGDDFYKAGLVYSPYQLFYTTDSLTTSDFNTQKGLASRYAVKMVNPGFYVRINLGA